MRDYQLTAIDPTARPRRYWASHVFAAETARRVHPAHEYADGLWYCTGTATAPTHGGHDE